MAIDWKPVDALVSQVQTDDDLGEIILKLYERSIEKLNDSNPAADRPSGPPLLMLALHDQGDGAGFEVSARMWRPPFGVDETVKKAGNVDPPDPIDETGKVKENWAVLEIGGGGGTDCRRDQISLLRRRPVPLVPKDLGRPCKPGRLSAPRPT